MRAQYNFLCIIDYEKFLKSYMIMGAVDFDANRIEIILTYSILKALNLSFIIQSHSNITVNYVKKLFWLSKFR